MRYPPTRAEPVQDALAGVSFPDPYRWLEEESEEVREWQRSQAQLASAHVREWPHFERLRELIARFHSQAQVAVPRYAAGRWFRIRAAEGSFRAQAVVSDQPMGEGRVLFDPMTADAGRPPHVSWLSPSPDGRTLALGVCADGSEKNTIRLLDVQTGELLAHPPLHRLMDNWGGGVQWLPDSSGFFFAALAGGASDIEQTVLLHRRLPLPATTPMDIVWTGSEGCRMVVVSRDDRHAVALERMTNPVPVAIAELAVGPLRWRPFVTRVSGTLAGHLVGDRYIAVTDVGAPRGRLVAVPLDAEDPNDPAAWQELVRESDAVLRTVTPVGDVLYLTELVDTYARVRMVALDGTELGEVALPGRGAIGEHPFPFGNLIPNRHPERFLFAFSTLTAAWGIYSHTPGEAKLETLLAPQVRLDDAVVEDRWAISADGTRIPYHLVRRTDVPDDRPVATLIYGYGGFNVPLAPQFPGAMAAFVAAGGAFVQAHLRGGGEFGLDWWEAGRFHQKQNSYDDLYAVAEDLVANGRCTPRQLAVTGRSNGGLMTGVALTQRSDLWAVAIPRAARLDLIGACRSHYGLRSALEDRLTDMHSPEEARRLAALSPYHLVRDGVSYPAVFVVAGATDPRCPAAESRKFTARLQAATAGSAPILLHVWKNAGHGSATDSNIAIAEYTEWLAFAMRHLGMGAMGIGD